MGRRMINNDVTSAKLSRDRSIEPASASCTGPEGIIEVRGLHSMAGIARLTALTVVSSGLTAALYAEPSFSQTSPSSVKVAQEAEAASSQAQGPFPPELPPGGTSIEDLLLQKGTITMDEWIQIRSEQEYKVADQTKRLDSLEDW